ncbi:MAG: CoA transferase [Deltaproteobacteria bacterium]|nr:CoA transferase [Deltaproteobacteria bacterium]
MAEATWRDYVQNKGKKPKPLKGLRVLEVCTIVFGPSGPSWLGEMGAEVIKVEIPPLGDLERDLSCSGFRFKEQSPLFLHDNINKYYLGLDLHKPEGQEIFCQLAAKADIIENNLRPGVMERFNVDYRKIEELNPGIIYIEKNGFGQWGPYAEENRPSNDGASQAFSGIAWMSSFPGQTPVKQMIYLSDMYGALLAEVAVLSALHHRDRTGKGQYIEISQTESIMRTMSWVWPYLDITGENPAPAGNRDVSICPADTFCCADDSMLSLAAAAPTEFAGLCAAMGQPELAQDPRFAEHLTRLKEENATALLSIIAQWASQHTAEEIEALAREHGFAAGRVRDAAQVAEDRGLQARGFMTQVDDAMYGEYLDHEFPVMMSATPPQKKWAARPVGFDNEYLLKNLLNLSDQELEALYQTGALGKWADRPGRRPPPDWDGSSDVILSRDMRSTQQDGEN